MIMAFRISCYPNPTHAPDQRASAVSFGREGQRAGERESENRILFALNDVYKRMALWREGQIQSNMLNNYGIRNIRPLFSVWATTIFMLYRIHAYLMVISKGFLVFRVAWKFKKGCTMIHTWRSQETIGPVKVNRI